MGGERFNLLLREVINGKPMQREWSTDEVLKNVAWLQRMNARGHNIFIRPSGEHGLALLGALKGGDLVKMSRDGLVPAVSIEISNDEFEAWVKLSHRALPAQLRRLAELELMRLVVDARKEMVNDGYGRMAGFVNLWSIPNGVRQASHVLAHEGSAEISQQARVCLKRVRTMLGDKNNSLRGRVLVPGPPGHAKPRVYSR